MAEIDYSKGKIPGAESGIEIRHSVCDICTPGMHCGLDVYVKDGKVIKVEGTPDHPQNKGKLCTKGLGSRQYLYRVDRILTPLRRVGERGEGKFEPISWDEAIDTIAEKLLSAREEYGAHRVASIRDTASGTGSCSGGLPGTMAARTTAPNPAAALPAA